MRLFLPLLLATACAPLRVPGEFTVEWPQDGDGFCIDAFGEGRATAGPIALPVVISGERRNGRPIELGGLTLELAQLTELDDGTLESQRVATATLDDSGRATLQLDVPEPPEDGASALMDLVLMIETDGDGLSTVDVNSRIVMEAVASDQVPWIGCQEWQNASGTPFPPDVALRVGAEATLAFHVEGNVDGAPDIEIIFRERGGDLCGPDPFGHFTTPVLSGANAVSWPVSLEGMEVCESERDGSEITFSTPSFLDADDVWVGTRESAERDVLP